MAILKCDRVFRTISFRAFVFSLCILFCQTRVSGTDLPTKPAPAVPECTEFEFKCDNSKCIMKRWVCDDEDDCGDNSDETPHMCESHTCPPEHHHCNGSNMCILDSWLCDGQEDCPNGSDELHCGQLQCTEGEFRCDDGQCIMSHWVCDGDADCNDRSDERNCNEMTCSPSEMLCVGTHRCIPKRWYCDGDPDCQDGSDEQNCTASVVPPGGDVVVVAACGVQEFTCHNLECVHSAWRCDGQADCVDGSDELECGSVELKCYADQFKCDVCLDRSRLCDGTADCSDGADELDCEHRCNETTAFDCYGDGVRCLLLSKLCDGHNDCGDNEDEQTDTCSMADPCKTNGGGCDHTCVFNRPHKICGCHPGFYLLDDKRSCRDIDECQQPGACSHNCTNLKGYYKCSCHDGYEVDRHKFCRAVERTERLLFANRIDVRTLNMRSREYRVLVTEARSAIAVDFDYEDEHVYWSDVTTETISRSLLLRNETTAYSEAESELIVSDSVRTPDGIAFDWVHKNIYWTDTGLKIIGVKSVKRAFQRQLITTGLEEPRAIVVDPRDSQRWIYWTDWGNQSKIEKAGLDGSQRTTIVTGSKLTWPNGLAIDYETNRLFWTDAKAHSISSCHVDGSDVRLVVFSPHSLGHPFGITVFEDTLYWTDWHTDSIYKVNKLVPATISKVVMETYSPMDIHIHHRLRQPPGVAACGRDNGRCSQLCLAVPRSVYRYSCHCNDGFHTDPHDHRRCLIVAKTTTVAAGLTTLKTLGPTEAMSGAADDQPSAPSRAGYIAGIVIAVLVITVLILTIAFFAYRSLSRKNIKSLNFSNPVYTKTTEDMVSLEKNEYQNSSAFEPLTASEHAIV